MLADYASDDENDDVLLKVDDLNREFKVNEDFLKIAKLKQRLLIFSIIRWKEVTLQKNKTF